MSTSCNLNGTNEKTPESHGCKRQVRLQKQRDQQSRARLACEIKRQRERRLQLREVNQQIRLQSSLRADVLSP